MICDSGKIFLAFSIHIGFLLADAGAETGQIIDTPLNTGPKLLVNGVGEKDTSADLSTFLNGINQADASTVSVEVRPPNQDQIIRDGQYSAYMNNQGMMTFGGIVLYGSERGLQLLRQNEIPSDLLDMAFKIAQSSPANGQHFRMEGTSIDERNRKILERSRSCDSSNPGKCKKGYVPILVSKRKEDGKEEIEKQPKVEKKSKESSSTEGETPEASKPSQLGELNTNSKLAEDFATLS